MCLSFQHVRLSKYPFHICSEVYKNIKFSVYVFLIQLRTKEPSGFNKYPKVWGVFIFDTGSSYLLTAINTFCVCTFRVFLKISK